MWYSIILICTYNMYIQEPQTKYLDAGIGTGNDEVDSFQYVPVLEGLKSLLQNEETLDEVR